MIKLSYIDAIGQGWPAVKANSIGPNYSDLQHNGGDPLPSQQDLDAWILAKAKENVWRLIQVERDRRTAGGVKVGANWYHSDQPSRIQQLGLVLFGANLPAGIMWKTMAGTFIEMTPTLAVQIFQSIAVSDQTIFAIAEQKRAEMMALADPSTYNVMTGWPVIYGEA